MTGKLKRFSKERMSSVLRNEIKFSKENCPEKTSKELNFEKFPILTFCSLYVKISIDFVD